ncbi:MAG: 4-(cytidine 5'-diphospho)-2-C-methyl-D-erythritol kinase, partial [Acidobacteriota bacterium]
YLEILGRRQDGYHELLTAFQMVDLHDDLTFEPTQSATSLRIKGRGLPKGDDNLVLKAISLLRREAGLSQEFSICLEKRIPVSGGMGGGSSNAAVTLLVANELGKCGLSVKELGQLGAQLGADVPFFLYGGTALGTGRGDTILPLPCGPVFDLIVATPAFGVSAAEAYRLFSQGAGQRLPRLTTRHANTTIRRFRELTAGREWPEFRNDLEEPVLLQYPVLHELRECMLKAGCKTVLLSGSGSSIFGTGDSSALRNARLLLQQAGMEGVLECRTLSTESYRERLIRNGLGLGSLNPKA